MVADIQSILMSLDQRTSQMADACTACGACVSVCPTPAIEGLDVSHPEDITENVRQILRGEQHTQEAAIWARQCCGSGFCRNVCDHGIDPRFMLTMARRALLKAEPLADRRRNGKAEFQTMSRGVKVISRLQLPPQLMEKLSPRSQPDRTAPPDVIFYTGCNMLKTPHIGLLCMDILDLLDISYEVHGGPSNCCGILQFRTGDDENAVRQATKTIERFANTGAKKMLAWCPTCQIQFGENLLPSLPDSGFAPTDITMFPVFLAAHLDKLKPLMTHRVEKTVTLHEYPGAEGVTEAVIKLLSAIDGIRLVDLKLPRAGYQMSSLLNADYAKKHLSNLLQAGKDAGITTFAGVYHADHRELVRHEPHWPFEVVNYMDLIGQSIGLERTDLFKRLRLMNDADAILAESTGQIEKHNLNVEDTRDAIINLMLNEQVLALKAGQPARTADG